MARSVAADRFVSTVLRGAESAVQRAFVAAVRQQLDRVEREARPTETIRFVDGIEGRPIEQVQPFGIVHFRFGYLRRIAEAALQILRETSPVDSGEYQRAHTVYVDGDAVADLARIGQARRIVIANDIPYARVVEVGALGKVPWSTQPQVPRQGVYRAAVREIKRRFGHVADIGFTFVGVDSGAMLAGRAASYSGNRFPAITIEAR